MGSIQGGAWYGFAVIIIVLVVLIYGAIKTPPE